MVPSLSNMNKTIGILGAGSWGTAMAQAFANQGHSVYLWHRSAKTAQAIQKTRINQKYFPNAQLHPLIEIISDWKWMIQHVEIIVLAVPTTILPYFLSTMLTNIRKDQVVLNAAKGLDHAREQTISQWIQSTFSKTIVEQHYGVLSGPTFAQEVMENKPTGMMLAFKDANRRSRIKSTLHATRFQIFETSDICGVEIAGALKNVIAITVGASDTLGFGFNSRAALLTKGQEEISHIGRALGALPETFWGLAGMGDLILTCTGDLSRNRRVGKKLAEGKNIRQVLKELGQIAEGIRTTKTAYHLSQKLGLKTPILSETYHSIFKGKSLQQAVETILLEMK